MLENLITVADRSFAAAGPKIWNSLPDDVTSAPSLPVFRQKLKTQQFQRSRPNIAPQWFLEVIFYLGRYKNCYVM